MKKLLLLLAILIAVAAMGQQPLDVTEKWFADPIDIKMDIPAFNKTSGFTSYKEMMQYLNDRISEYPELISMEIIGKTQKGSDIPFVTVKKKEGNDNKLRIFYTGRVHGNEPSGTEALLYFIRQLIEDKEVNSLLDKMEFYIMPMINIDGAEKNNRYTANGIDLNRDQSKLDTPEAEAYHAGSKIAKPDIAVDFHEFQPTKALYSKIYDQGDLSVPWDIMFLYSENPNVAKSIRNAVDVFFLPHLRQTMDNHSLTHYTYYAPSEDANGVTFTIGGSSPRSTSTSIALKNSISLLMETRGIQLGRTSALRRVYSAYLAALSVALTAYENEDMIRKTIAEAISDRSDIAVKFSFQKNNNYPLKFIDLHKNDTLTINVNALLSHLPPKVTQSASLPRFYYLLPSETKAADLLSKIGVETTVLQKAKTVTVHYYVVSKITTGKDPVGGVVPVTVTTKKNSKEITLPEGTIVVSTDQRNVRIATMLLEPEANNGFVSFKVINPVNNQELPIYKEL